MSLAPPVDEKPPEEPYQSIKFRIEYQGSIGADSVDVDPSSEPDAGLEPAVLEAVDIRETEEIFNHRQEKRLKAKGKLHSYIRILSPAVNEALRCVVDYYPGLNLSEIFIKVHEPYSVFFFYEKELEAYRNRLENLAEQAGPTCANRFAHKHLGIALDFVRGRMGKAVEEERKRHERGFCTFDMLWLLYKPGAEVYYDWHNVGEHNPHIFHEIESEPAEGTTKQYSLSHWNMDADSNWVGAGPINSSNITRFAGEKAITELVSFPCEFLRFAEGMTEEDVKQVREHFVNRGKMWYRMRRKPACYSFKGVTCTFPRRNFVSNVMVDPIQYAMQNGLERRILNESVAHPSGPLGICSCETCDKLIYQQACEPRFPNYSQINPLVAEHSLTDEQYFLCDSMVEAFLFKTREWSTSCPFPTYASEASNSDPFCRISPHRRI